ncbi:MAG: anti-sigma factor RsbA family regulatory protein [Streptosporangiaceae bacterium]
MEDPGVADGTCRHIALLYREPTEYKATVDDFVKAAISEQEPVFVAVPQAQLSLLSQQADNCMVSVADMEELGRNPARIIAALQSFADKHAGRRIRYLGESLWLGRTKAERRETARLEALLNLAFADAEVTMMCPYNASNLPRSAITSARRTHPLVLTGGRQLSSHHYAGPDEPPGWLTDRLPAPPRSAQTLEYKGDLRPVRALVAAAADRARLSAERSTDLVIAASEVAANTLRHTTGGGIIRLWHTRAEILCQVDDGGFISDPLAGYFRPAGDMPGRQGLWLVNQICDLVEVRTASAGTTIRMHMRR